MSWAARRATGHPATEDALVHGVPGAVEVPPDEVAPGEVAPGELVGRS